MHKEQMKHLGKWVIAAIVFILLITSLQSKEVTTETPETIAIGSISALVGTGSAIGEEERNGALLAIEEINIEGGIRGKKIELISENLSFDNLKLASAIATKLATIDNVYAVVGPQWDEPTEAAIPTLEAAKIPTIGADITRNIEKTANYEYLFSTWYDNQVGIEQLLSYAESKNISDFVIIRPIDGGFWKYTADLFTQGAKDHGIRILDDIKLNDPFETDYRTTLTKIKSLNPQAVFIVVTDPTQCVFMKQVKELGIDALIFGTEASGSYASLETCGELLEKLHFATPAPTESSIDFIKRYEVRFGRKPQYPSAITAYDAVMIIAEALKETRFARGEVLRDAIAATKNKKGASMENLTFDEKGFVITPKDAWEVQTVRNGSFVKAE